MAAQQWFVEVDGVVEGPLTANDLRAWARSGRLTWSTRLRLEGREGWMCARDIPGLLPAETLAESGFDPAAPASDLFEDYQRSTATPVSLDPEAVVAAGGASALDPSARPEELFDNYPSPAAGSGVRRSAQAPPRPPPRPLSPRSVEPPSRDEARAQAVLALNRAQLAPSTRTIGARLIEAPLDLPRWQNLWPLATLCLLLGWIVGGFFSFDRMYGSSDVLPVCLLALGGVPLACAAMLYYLRPKQVPLGSAIGVALFTAIAGIILLLVLQFLAAVAAHSSSGVGRGGALFALLALIGHLYDMTNSDHLVQRWIGFVFGVGLLEEMTKLLPLSALVVWRSDRQMSVHSFLFVGFASGLGFGIGEAFYGYAPWNGNHGLDANIIRWYSAVPSHALYTTVCAAFLWKMADHVEHAEGFWERALFVALAAAVMAVVHGTYNTVCSLGIVPSLVMEVLSFALLVWIVAWVTRDSTEPRESVATPWLGRVLQVRTQGIGLACAAVLLVGAGLLSSSRDDVLPDLIRSSLPQAFRPYIEGVAITHTTDKEPFPVPLQLEIIFDADLGMIAHFHNQGSEAFSALSVDCRNGEGEHDTFDLGPLPAGEEATLSDDDWSFAPGDALTITVNDRNIIRVRLP